MTLLFLLLASLKFEEGIIAKTPRVVRSVSRVFSVPRLNAFGRSACQARTGRLRRSSVPKRNRTRILFLPPPQMRFLCVRNLISEEIDMIHRFAAEIIDNINFIV